MARIKEWNGEVVFSVILFALGLMIVVLSLRLGFGEFRNPGGGFFPFFCGLIICIQSFLLHVFKQKRSTTDNLFNNVLQIKYFLALITFFILWVILMPLLGWLAVTFLITLSISKMMGLKGWVKPLFLSVSNTLLLYLIFGYWLHIDLPTGFWVRL